MYADGDDQWKGYMDDAEEICKKECIEGKRKDPKYVNMQLKVTYVDRY